MAAKKDFQTFREQAFDIHGDKYSYDEKSYVNTNTKMKIKCPNAEHPVFEQTPNSHLSGYGCSKCARENSIKSFTQFEEEANKVHNNKYKGGYIESTYVNTITRMKIKCSKHDYVFEQSPHTHLKGSGCPKCAREQTIIKKTKSFAQFEKEANQIHNNKYKGGYIESTYVNTNTKMKIECPRHGIFEQRPSGHLSGRGCPKCPKEQTIIKQTKSFIQFEQEANQIHNNKYKVGYIESTYVDSRTRMKIKCSKHDYVFEQTPNSHLKGSGCPKCAREQTIIKKTKSFTQFEKEANQIHNNKYKGGYIEKSYVNTDTKMQIICPNTAHPVFEQLPSNHLSGNGCPLCAKEQQIKSFTQFEKEANQIHNNKYKDGYDESTYVNTKTKIQIKCPESEHGVFEQLPSSHLSGQGCPKCGLKNKKKSFVQFEEEANQIHNNKYKGGYIESTYVNTNTKMKIECPRHGIFEQRPSGHLSGYGCLDCANEKKIITCSTPFKEVVKYIRTLNLKTKQEYYDWWDANQDNLEIDLPRNVEYVFKGKGYISWNHILNNYTDKRIIWTKSKIKDFLNEIKDLIKLLSFSELNAILEIKPHLKTFMNTDEFKKIIKSPENSKERISLVDELLNVETNNHLIDEMNFIDDDVELDYLEFENIEDIMVYPKNNNPQIFYKNIKAVDKLYDQIKHTFKSNEPLNFILNSQVQKLWRHRLWRIEFFKHDGYSPEESVLKVNAEEELGLADSDPNRPTLVEYRRIRKLVDEFVIPSNYNNHKPNEMQKYTAVLIKEKKIFGNWSGTGAGKTISALLSIPYCNSKSILLVCVNSTITGWTNQFNLTFKDCDVYVKHIPKEIDTTRMNVFIINYEFLQSHDQNQMDNICSVFKFDMIILDEVQNSKQRSNTEESYRRQLLSRTILNIKKIKRTLSEDLYLICLSATPITNNLSEPLYLLELMSRARTDIESYIEENHELERTTIQNISKIHSKLIDSGIYYQPINKSRLTNSENNGIIKIDIDGTPYKQRYYDLKKKKGTYQDFERLEVEIKIENLVSKDIPNKTIIYSYIQMGVIEKISKWARDNRRTVCYYTGEEHGDFLKDFIEGDKEILFCSHAIAVGVDGLQNVSNNLIILSLPWSFNIFK